MRLPCRATGLAWLVFVLVSLLPLVQLAHFVLGLDGRLDPSPVADLLLTRDRWVLLGASLLVAGGASSLALVIGLSYAVLIAKTDLWGRRLFGLAYLVPLLIPPYMHAIVWSRLLAANGSLNGLLVSLPDLASHPLDVHNVMGAVLVLGLAHYPFVTLLARSGLRSIDGRLVSSPRTLVPANRRRLGMVFQDLALWPHMTAFANVAFGLHERRARREQMRQRVDEVLVAVSLAGKAERYPHQLSGGEHQRLAIARAMAPRPACLLMDEPFSSLDPVLKLEMFDLLTAVKRELDTGIIYVTHNLDEAVHLADRAVVMNGGRLHGTIGFEDLAGRTEAELLTWYRLNI
jgi:iron(III) transport system ATP-binding protein